MLTYASMAVLGVIAIYLWKRSQHKRRKIGLPLKGKVVAITGGGSGIGQELAVRMATMEQAEVFVLDLNVEGMRQTKERIDSAGGKCQIFPCDVSNKEQVYDFVRMIESKDIYIDILVNNAGISYKKPFVDCTDQEMEQTFKVNVFAHFYTIKACLPSMVERGGHIVQIGSVMDSLATHSLAAYTASKWAVAGFTETLREELSDFEQIQVTLVRPWVTSTPMFDDIQYWNHDWAALLCPPTNIVDVSNAVISGIKDKSNVVTVPSHLYIFSILFYLIPSSFRIRMLKLLGLDRLIN